MRICRLSDLVTSLGGRPVLGLMVLTSLSAMAILYFCNGKKSSDVFLFIRFEHLQKHILRNNFDVRALQLQQLGFFVFGAFASA